MLRVSSEDLDLVVMKYRDLASPAARPAGDQVGSALISWWVGRLSQSLFVPPFFALHPETASRPSRSLHPPRAAPRRDEPWEPWAANATPYPHRLELGLARRHDA